MADDRMICGTCKWCWKEHGYWCCRNRYSINYDKTVSYTKSCKRHDFRDNTSHSGITISIPGKRTVPRIED